MTRADRISRLIAEWQEHERMLLSCVELFRDSPASAEAARHYLFALRRCLDDLQRASYPLDRPNVCAECTRRLDEAHAVPKELGLNDHCRHKNEK